MRRFIELPQSALCDVTIKTKIFNYGRIVGWSHSIRVLWASLRGR